MRERGREFKTRYFVSERLTEKKCECVERDREGRECMSEERGRERERVCVCERERDRDRVR